MQLTVTSFLIVLPMVFLAAMVDSISGGGGLLSLPAYTLVGLDYNYASGCNKFSALFGTLVATIRYYKSGKLLVIPALFAAPTALPGSWLGAKTSMVLGTDFMNMFMIIAIPIIAIPVLLQKRKQQETKPITKKSYIMCMVVGFIVGFYDGLFGPGAGTFMIIAFTQLVGMDMVTASATAKPVNLASNIAALVARVAAGTVVYSLAIPATFCSIAGGLLGSKLALVRGARIIRYVMLGVLALLVIKLAFEIF